jgi:hypothetical protein
MKKIVILITLIAITYGGISQDLVYIKNFNEGFSTHIQVTDENNIVALSDRELYMYNPSLDSVIVLNVPYTWSYAATQVENQNLLVVGNGISKINNTGDVLFQMPITGLGRGADVVMLNDSSYLIGTTREIIRITSNGDSIWRNDYRVYDLEHGLQNNFFTTYQTYLRKFDYNGNLLMEKNLDDLFFELNEVKTFENGDLLVSGRSKTAGEVLLCRLTDTGDNLWTKNMGNPIFNNCCPYFGNVSIDISQNGIALATTDIDNDLWLVYQLNFNGNILWQNTVSDNYSEGHCIVQVFNDSIYVMGTRNLTTFTSAMAVFTEMLSTGINVMEESIVEVYPNPSSGSFIISNLANSTSVKLYDITGKEILSGVAINNEFKITQLTSGTYIVKTQLKDKMQTFKVLVE